MAMTLAGCQSRTDTDAGSARSAKVIPDSQLPLRMRPKEIRDFLDGHPEALILDVRDSTEWNDDLGHIQGSKLVPLRSLGGRLQEIEGWRDKPIVVVSRLGDRGGAAVIVLREAGFQQVTGVEGGLEAWRRAGY
jgi:sulfur dioxygenase